ncbi:hypothetical protein GCM10010504_36360 [Streptomyces griseus]|nr:hypothetical protein GCM10010504_36360 [Streptomyces griseus]
MGACRAGGRRPGRSVGGSGGRGVGGYGHGGAVTAGWDPVLGARRRIRPGLGWPVLCCAVLCCMSGEGRAGTGGRNQQVRLTSAAPALCGKAARPDGHGVCTGLHAHPDARPDPRPDGGCGNRMPGGLVIRIGRR